jgi:hypothetical protein
LSHQKVVIFAFTHSLVDECIFLLIVSLLEELGNQSLLICLLVERSLCIELIDDHLSAAAITLLSCKVRILLGFFDFVHSGSVGEVLNLSWGDAPLFLLLLDSLLH